MTEEERWRNGENKTTHDMQKSSSDLRKKQCQQSKEIKEKSAMSDGWEYPYL